MWLHKILPFFTLVGLAFAQGHELTWKPIKGETWIREDHFDIEVVSFMPGMPRMHYTIINRSTMETIDVADDGAPSLLFTYTSSRVENGPETISKFAVESLLNIPMMVVFNKDKTVEVTPQKPIPSDGQDQFDFTYQGFSILRSRLADLSRNLVKKGDSWRSFTASAFNFADFTQDSVTHATYVFQGEKQYKGSACYQVDSKAKMVTTFTNMEGDLETTIDDVCYLDLETRFPLLITGTVYQKGLLNTPDGSVFVDLIVRLRQEAHKVRGEN